MCIDRISKTKPRPTGIGYKAFRVKPGSDKLYGEFARKRKPRLVGEWLNAADYMPFKTETRKMMSQQYSTGWYIFKTLKGIEQWMFDDLRSHEIKKVEYRGAHTEGYWENWYDRSNSVLAKRHYKQIVATEIKILP